MPTERTLYDVIGVKPSATDSEIKDACLRLGGRFRPDENSRPDQIEWFAEIEKAYEILNDPDRRRSYDEQIHLSETVVDAADQDTRPKATAIGFFDALLR